MKPPVLMLKKSYINITNITQIKPVLMLKFHRKSVVKFIFKVLIKNVIFQYPVA